MTQWHHEVCKRDSFRCQHCKTLYSHPYCFLEDGRNAYVVGHHLKRKRRYPELKLETDNGICLDKKCHDGVHNGTITLTQSDDTTTQST